MKHTQVRAQYYQSIMAKRSQRRNLRYEKDQGGCMSGLMTIFHFRHGRSTRKFLADRRRGSRQVNVPTGVGSSSTRSTVENPKDKSQNPKKSEENMATADAVETSVKKLLEGEMVNEKVLKKQMNVSTAGSEELSSENENRVRMHHKQRNRTSRNSIDMDIRDDNTTKLLELEVHKQNNFDNFDLRTVVHHKSPDCIKSDFNIDYNMQAEEAFNIVPENLSAAIKIFLSERLTDNRHSRDDGKTHHSEALMDTLETISSNKEIILKLLQDPNSLLLKHEKGSQGALLKNEQKSNSLSGSTILDEVLIRSVSSEPTGHKPTAHKYCKYFSRGSKSQKSNRVDRDEICQSPSKIVIVKPESAGSRYLGNETNISTLLHSCDSEDKKVQGDRHASRFSFTEIKRRLQHAMGKEHQGICPRKILCRYSSMLRNRGHTEKGVGTENRGWSSPNRSHFYTERFAKPSLSFRKGGEIGKSKDAEATIINESSGYSSQRASNIYFEGKKHLSEVLENGEANVELIERRLQKPLGRILSLPEYKVSPIRSPEKDIQESFITAKMRLAAGTSSGYSNRKHQHSQENLDSYIDPLEPTADSQTDTSCERYANNTPVCEVMSGNSIDEIISSKRDVMTPEGVLEIDVASKTTEEEEDKFLNELDIPVSTSPSSKDVQTVAIYNEIESSQYLDLESLGDNEESSSPEASLPCYSVTTKGEDPEKIVDRTDRTSPISVLEPVFSEDDISPASTIDRKVILEIHPQKIQFEEKSLSSGDQGVTTITFVEDGESPFEYVEAVLLGSGLSWDDYLPRWLSSDQILDPSLLDEVELISSRPHDQKLLFDFTNKVLKDVCDSYFGCFIGKSSLKQSIRPAPRGMDLIHEIWEGVERHLLQHPLSQSLDQLLEKDMTKSGMWMDLHLDMVNIGREMEEAIFEELVQDTISSIIDDTRECVVTVFPDGQVDQGNE